MNLNSFFIVFVCAFAVLDVHASPQKSRWWADVEYLHWWSQDSPINVPLATQNPSASAIINQPGTQIIFGKGSSKDSFHFGGMEGSRVTLGRWLDPTYHYGIEGSGFGFMRKKQTFVVSSVGLGKPILDVPFFSVESSSENVLVGNRPNTITESDTFQPYNLELNGLYDLTDSLQLPLIMSAGFRFISIHEHLILNDTVYDTSSLPVNSVLNIQDRFTTKNHLYGFQMGARSHFAKDNIEVEALGKVALAVNIQQLQISGETNVDSTRILQPIGLFAEPTNIGTSTRHFFAVLPELEMKIGYHFSHFIYPFFSYNVLYISRVIRASNEIDRNINLSQNPLIGGSGILTGPAAPLKQFNETSLWMQGVSIGVRVNLH